MENYFSQRNFWLKVFFSKKIMCEFHFFSSLSVSQSMQCLFFMSQNITMRKKRKFDCQGIYLFPQKGKISSKVSKYSKLRWDSSFETKRVEIVNRVHGSKWFLVKMYSLFSFTFFPLTQHNITFQYLTEISPSYPWMGDTFCLE